MTTDRPLTFVVAEAGVNHNGDLSRALEMIDAAAEAGADAVKFQTFHPEEVISRHAPKASYQLESTDGKESQLDMVRKFYLDDVAHRRLHDHAKAKAIEFLSTPFDVPSLEFLARDLDLSRLKISSGDINNAQLLLRAAQTNKNVILSTGMSTLNDITEALGVLAFGYSRPKESAPARSLFAGAYASPQGMDALRRRVTLLHCTTEYPAPFAEVNLRAMDTLRKTFGLPVGLSDHSPGIPVAIAAAARGAAVLEKHFTLNRNLPGPDHKASLEPQELAQMVAAIRNIESALGTGEKIVMPSEAKNKFVVRRSLVARTEIRRGEPFTVENLTAKRPGTGISPMNYWDWLGRFANRDYAVDEMIDPQ